MKELINAFVEKAGLSEESATKAADTAINFVKEKLPPGLSDKVEDIFNGNFDLSSIMGSLGGLFGGGSDNSSESPLDKLKNMFGDK